MNLSQLALFLKNMIVLGILIPELSFAAKLDPLVVNPLRLYTQIPKLGRGALKAHVCSLI